MKKDTREIHITVRGNMIGLKTGPDGCGIDAVEAMEILCGAIATIYLEAKKEGTRDKDFADVIRNNIIKLLTVAVWTKTK